MLSCGKENTSYRANITILSLSGIPIPAASVKLTVPVINANEFFGTTDQDGRISFEVPAKAYYDVWTWRGSFRGCGYVEFKEGESVEQIVYIRTYNDPLNTCFD